MTRPRIVLADDHKMLTEAFVNLLAVDYDIVASTANGRDLVEAVKRHKPDLVIVDISMPMLNGLDACRQIKLALPDVKVIFLTVNEDPELVAEAFRCGASGYVLKNCAVSELTEAIEQALCDRSYVTPLITEGAVNAFLKGPGHGNALASLTPRQREVLQLLAEGRSMKQVARILDIAPRTVAFHKYRIMEKLQAKTNAELIHFAIKNNIVAL
ncbi:MAG: response regulator transcription factor [Phycisphaerae bacterium]